MLAAEAAAGLALLDEGGRRLLPQALDVAEPDAHGAGLDPASGSALVHVGR